MDTTGIDVLGGTVIGMIDVAATQRDLNAMRSLSVGQARVLLPAGQKMIDAAISSAGSLPGDAKRQEVFWKLRWHKEALGKEQNASASYGAGNDLKRWVQQAAIELNATEEGKRYQQAAWDAMVDDVKSRAVALAEKPGAVLDTVLSVPAWAWAIGGGVLLFGGGLIAWRLRR